MMNLAGKFLLFILLQPCVLFAESLLGTLEKNSETIHSLRKQSDILGYDGKANGNYSKAQDYNLVSATILSGGKKIANPTIGINLGKQANDSERKTMVRSIMTTAITSDQAFCDYYKFYEGYENNASYLRHMAAIYMTYTITRDFHAMVELQPPYQENFYKVVSHAQYWTNHFGQTTYQPYSCLQSYILNYINNNLLDQIITNDFAAIYADINTGCKDVTKQWKFVTEVDEQELLFTKKGFDLKCPLAVHHIHEFGSPTENFPKKRFLYEIEHEKAEYLFDQIADIDGLNGSWNMNISQASKESYFSEVLPQLAIFTLENEADFYLAARWKEGQTFPYFRYNIDNPLFLTPEKGRQIFKYMRESLGNDYLNNVLLPFADKIMADRLDVSRKNYREKVKSAYEKHTKRNIDSLKTPEEFEAFLNLDINNINFGMDPIDPIIQNVLKSINNSSAGSAPLPTHDGED